MKILVVGGGGREHAIAWKLNQSSKTTSLYVAPGNPGAAQFAENVDISAEAIDELVSFAVENTIDLVVVGPEAPLVDGLVDKLTDNNIAAFGPTQAAAQIESSKAFSKDLMAKLAVPTAKYQTFTEVGNAKDYVSKQGAPIVVKASGLAAGKGAVVCETLDQALETIEEIMVDKSFGDAGNEVVIEEFLEGPEISIHVLSDGINYVILPPSQDHKPIGEGNTGPNTGGMGTVAPLPGVSDELMVRIDQEIVAPIIKGLADNGTPYTGLLYPGLMLTDDGPKVLEFNCRFGDPETQGYMRLLDSDLVDVLMACTDQTLDQQKVAWSESVAVNIVLAADGYPGSYEKGNPISGIDEAEQDKDVAVFHAGTKREGDQLVTNGGRVLGVTAVSSNLDEARTKAYAASGKVEFAGKQFRRDIGVSHDNSKLDNF